MRSALAAVLTSCALALVGCEKKTSEPPPPSAPSGGTAGAPASGGTPGVNGDTILIGEVGSLTGSEATFGISTRNAIELAMRRGERRRRGEGQEDRGPRLRRPGQARGGGQRRHPADHPGQRAPDPRRGGVAPTRSPWRTKAQAAKVPMITPSSTNPKVTQIGDYIFRVCFIDPFQGYVMAKFAHDNLKLTKVAVLQRPGAPTTARAWRTSSSGSSPRWAGRSSPARPTPRATPTSARS